MKIAGLEKKLCLETITEQWWIYTVKGYAWCVFCKGGRAPGLVKPVFQKFGHGVLSGDARGP